jgi:hypothetical protein
MEQWLPVVGFEGFYEVSNLGQVRGIGRSVPSGRSNTKGIRRVSGKIVTQANRHGGYLSVWLCKLGKGQSFLVHRLVAEAFLGPCPPGKEVDHINRDRAGNILSNLRYVTRRQNQDGIPRPGFNKLTKDQVAEIRQAQGSQRDIAALYGIHQATVHHIKNGKTHRLCLA